MTPPDFVVVKTHPSLLAYVDGLQRKNAEALSFYPLSVFEREAQKGRLFLGLLNGEPCGYLYIGAASGTIRCHQVCIQYDARRRLYGAMLVQALEDHAVNAGGAQPMALSAPEVGVWMVQAGLDAAQRPWGIQ